MQTAGLHSERERDIVPGKRRHYLPADGVVRRFVHSFSFRALLTILALYVLIVVFSDGFFSPVNFNSVLTGIALLGILAIAESLVFLIGCIDLSVVSIYLLSGVLTSLAVMEWKAGLLTGILMSTTAGVALGAINGVFVVKFKAHPVISSLGILLLTKGLANILVTQISGFGSPKSLLSIKEWDFLNIPFPVVVLLILLVLFYWLLKSTIIGRQIFAVGGNEYAAKISGLNIDKIKLLVYISAGALASLAGIIFSYDTSLMSKNFGLGNEFDMILAVLIGGVSIYSGPSTINRAFLGAVIVMSIKYILILNSVTLYYQVTLTGCLLLLASLLQRYFKKR